MCYGLSPEERKEYFRLKAERSRQPKLKYSKEIKTFHVSGFVHPRLSVLTHANPEVFEDMQWGIIPEDGYNIITLNARAETIFEKPLFKKAIFTQRCVLFVNGFYESREVSKKKYPYYIYPKDGGHFAFACVYYYTSLNKTGADIPIFSIITCHANEVMSMIHNTKLRMPVILAEEEIGNYLNPSADKLAIQSFFKPSADEILAYHPVSRDISRKGIATNYPGIQDKVSYPELESLLDF